MDNNIYMLTGSVSSGANPPTRTTAPVYSTVSKFTRKPHSPVAPTTEHRGNEVHSEEEALDPDAEYSKMDYGNMNEDVTKQGSLEVVVAQSSLPSSSEHLEVDSVYSLLSAV